MIRKFDLDHAAAMLKIAREEEARFTPDILCAIYMVEDGGELAEGAENELERFDSDHTAEELRERYDAAVSDVKMWRLACKSLAYAALRETRYLIAEALRNDSSLVGKWTHHKRTKNRIEELCASVIERACSPVTAYAYADEVHLSIEFDGGYYTESLWYSGDYDYNKAGYRYVVCLDEAICRKYNSPAICDGETIIKLCRRAASVKDTIKTLRDAYVGAVSEMLSDYHEIGLSDDFDDAWTVKYL